MTTKIKGYSYYSGRDNFLEILPSLIYIRGYGDHVVRMGWLGFAVEVTFS